MLYAQWKLANVDYSANLSSEISKKVQSLPFTYNDLMFSEGNTGMNPQLAKVSIGLSSAAYNEAYVRQLMASMGFSVKTYNYNKQETSGDFDYVAYAIGNKTVDYSGKKYNLIIVAVRGTHGSYDWYGNTNVGTGDDHAGFYAGAKGVCSSIMTYMHDDSKENILLVTGHSRGAAVANVVAGKFATDAQFKDTVTPANLYGYTFATPAVSKKADTSLKNIYNFCNKGDVVTAVPLEKWGFKRFGQDIILTDSKTKGEMKSKFKALTGKEFKGSFDEPGYLNGAYEWVNNSEDLYKAQSITSIPFNNNGVVASVTAEMTPHEVLNATVTLFLIKSKSETEIKNAVDTIVFMLRSDMDKPVSLLMDALGISEAEVPVLLALPNEAKFIDAYFRIDKVKELLDVVTYTHSQEAYYAWVDVLAKPSYGGFR